ncbi:phosphatase PAP2 family protein [Oceanicola sp. 22II-s10i]|uniref:phosphatase PAP2 family protein n=1 Tax=Oceanicola sp. 22II-s10i TaxID=1317116 RepID=UPI0015963A70|nr:phosphatase PAP2 family protein [Oceanicola sp. 22II-s10i]
MRLCRPYIYALVLLAGLAVAIMTALTRAEIAPDQLMIGITATWKLAAIWFLLRWLRPRLTLSDRTMSAIFTLAEALFLANLLITVLRHLDYASKVIVFPYADRVLAKADRALGLDWLAYFGWIHDQPWLHMPMITAYDYLNSAIGLCLFGLLVMGRSDRARAMVEALVICSLISVFVGAFFPARAAVAALVPDMAAFPDYAFTPGIYHVRALELLRAPDGPVVIGAEKLVGLTTFPSLHTAMAVLILLAARGTPLLVPACLYAALMIPATPIWGGHYFVDLIAGAAMAVAVWALVRRSMAPAADRAATGPPAGQALPVATEATGR